MKAWHRLLTLTLAGCWMWTAWGLNKTADELADTRAQLRACEKHRAVLVDRELIHDETPR